MSANKSASENKTIRVPLAMPVELESRIIETAQRVKLSKQDTMRLSLERGLVVLLAQLQPPTEAQVVTPAMAA